MNEAELSVAVMPGDGIGVEVMDACLYVLEAVQRRVGGFRLRGQSLDAGAGTYRRTGTQMSDEVLKAAGAADAILLGAMGLPDVRLPDGRELAPQLDLRETLGLFAGVRPIRLLPGVRSPLVDPRAATLDLVIIRESTEGLFAERTKGRIENDQVARDAMVITRKTSEHLFDFALGLGRRRKAQGCPGRVDCVDKSNVLRSMAFFRQIFLERSAAFPDVEAGSRYVDATALDLVRQPWIFDVMVTENLFGDILSDLGAALVGGMGMAPSADIGLAHAVFQPSHGTAPDIMGKGIANPTAMFLSAGMMLDWLGEQHDLEACRVGGRLLREAVDRTYRSHAIRPVDQGGGDGTRAVAEAVVAALAEGGATSA